MKFLDLGRFITIVSRIPYNFVKNRAHIRFFLFVNFARATWKKNDDKIVLKKRYTRPFPHSTLYYFTCVLSSCVCVFFQIAFCKYNFISFTEKFNSSSTTPSGSGYFLVMPQLTVNGTALPLDAVSCQTHLVKLLGSLPDWEPRLRVAKECGYNMLHLTPIHRLGVSNSSYSIMDHHSLNDTLHSVSLFVCFFFFKYKIWIFFQVKNRWKTYICQQLLISCWQNTGRQRWRKIHEHEFWRKKQLSFVFQKLNLQAEKEATFEDVKNLVDKLEKEWNMLTVQDVVWNHAAKNAPWLLVLFLKRLELLFSLQEHPECAYNCFNSPHLRPAYVVDRYVCFSSNRKIRNNGLF